MKKDRLKNKKREEYQLPHLPDSIIHEILVRIPSEILHNKFRFICKSWYDLISGSEFLSLVAKQTKEELLIQHITWSGNGKSRYRVESLQMDENKFDIKVSKLDMKPNGWIRSSCNGLILMQYPNIEGVQFVMNTSINLKVSVPQCLSGCPHYSCGSGIGYVPSTNEYKVVHIYADGFGFEIFNLSTNAWKQLPGPFRDQFDRPFDIDNFFWDDPVSINGQIMHWWVDSYEFIVSFDVMEEKSSKTYLPDCESKRKRHDNELLEIGGYLAVVYHVSSTQLDVWILEDFLKQVWTKKHSIIADSLNYTSQDRPSLTKFDTTPPDFSKLELVASLRNGEVVMFKYEKTSIIRKHRVFLYDFKRNEMKKFGMTISKYMNFLSHTRSLLRLPSSNISIS